MRSASRPSLSGQPVSTSKDSPAGVMNNVDCPPSTSKKKTRSFFGCATATVVSRTSAAKEIAAIRTLPPRFRQRCFITLSSVFHADRFYGGAHRSGGNAAVDKHCLAGNVLAGLRCKKDHCAVQILRSAGTLERNAVHQILDPLLVFVEHCILGRFEPSGREAVDGDAMFAPV